MTYKFSFAIILSVLFFCAFADTAFGEPNDPNVLPAYVASGSQPTVAPPTRPPWDYAPNALPKTLSPGGHIWVGAYNFPDPKRRKMFIVSISSPNDTSGLTGGSPCGYDPSGSTIGGKAETYDLFGTWTCVVDFDKQPAFEMIKIKNDGNSNITIEDIGISYICYEMGSVENQYHIESATIGNADFPMEITSLLLSHEYVFTDASKIPQLQPSVPGDIWMHEYITYNPIHGLSIPQGAWLWTCVEGDGIGAQEAFNMSMTMMECMTEGRCILLGYDRLRDEWQTFRLSSNKPPSFGADVTGDCKIDRLDLAEICSNWLKGF
ncbi:MAG: hypothetical protein ACYS32_03295 [Planctomycetota bacterium]|jgi:hypothetical protein